MRSIVTVAQDVARMRGVPFTDIVSSRRTRTIVQPRQEAMYFARELTTASLPMIGRHLGGRDHTTVLHGCRSIERRLTTEPVYADEISAMMGRIRDHLHRQVPFLAERSASGTADSLEIAETFHRLAELEAALEVRERKVDERERDLRQAELDAVERAASNPSPGRWLRAFQTFENQRFGKGENLAFQRLIEALTEFRTAFKEQENM